MTEAVRMTGLDELAKALKGPAFRDVNRELRQHARTIARDLIPPAEDAVARSRAPQAHAVARTARVHSDRVPVFAFGKTNPRLRGFAHPGESGASRKRRRGAIAHGVVYGPAGRVNYYRIGRDPSGGPLGDSLQRSGKVYQRALDTYLRVYLGVLRAHGFHTEGG